MTKEDTENLYMIATIGLLIIGIFLFIAKFIEWW
jgi:hypothetical protein